MFCAPIDTTNDFVVLDVGTGTGIWALEVAEYVGHCFTFFSVLTIPLQNLDSHSQSMLFSAWSHTIRLTRSQVEGIDLSFMQPAKYVHHFSGSSLTFSSRVFNCSVPPNISWHVPRDFEETAWGVAEEAFDLVHVRGACGAVAELSVLYEKVKRYTPVQRPAHVISCLQNTQDT